MAPMLIVRVETDWFVHGTEFRYVLQPGEAISASHDMPIGQVLFVPRQEIALRDGTEEELAASLSAHEPPAAAYDCRIAGSDGNQRCMTGPSSSAGS